VIGGSPVPAKTPEIVVIDDSPTSISLYELSIGPLDVNLRSFQSASESLLYLQDHEADLVFLDVLMREKDGLTLLKKLRGMKRHQNTVVVMVTSKDYHQDRHIARGLGVREYLVKPLRSQEIREIICKYTDAQPDSDQKI
jgi:CheY-like chemotaxis protein